MKTKLTLKLDRQAVDKGKRYAKRHGLSLSWLVESYLLDLTEADQSEERLPSVVAELAGAVPGAEGDDAREKYTEYLQKKYS